MSREVLNLTTNGATVRLEPRYLSEGDKRDSKHGLQTMTLLRSQRPGLGPGGIACWCYNNVNMVGLLLERILRRVGWSRLPWCSQIQQKPSPLVSHVGFIRTRQRGATGLM